MEVYFKPTVLLKVKPFADGKYRVVDAQIDWGDSFDGTGEFVQVDGEMRWQESTEDEVRVDTAIAYLDEVEPLVAQALRWPLNRPNKEA